MTTAVRTKSAPKRKEKATIKVRFSRRILISDLRIKDEIVTSETRVSALTKGMSEAEMRKFLKENDLTLYDLDEIVVAKSVVVKEIDECSGKWRTHIHVNKQDCYDTRGYIRIVDKDLTD